MRYFLEQDDEGSVKRIFLVREMEEEVRIDILLFKSSDGESIIVNPDGSPIGEDLRSVDNIRLGSAEEWPRLPRAGISDLRWTNNYSIDPSLRVDPDPPIETPPGERQTASEISSYSIQSTSNTNDTGPTSPEEGN